MEAKKLVFFAFSLLFHILCTFSSRDPESTKPPVLPTFLSTSPLHLPSQKHPLDNTGSGQATKKEEVHGLTAPLPSGGVCPWLSLGQLALFVALCVMSNNEGSAESIHPAQPRSKEGPPAWTPGSQVDLPPAPCSPHFWPGCVNSLPASSLFYPFPERPREPSFTWITSLLYSRTTCGSLWPNGRSLNCPSQSSKHFPKATDPKIHLSPPSLNFPFPTPPLTPVGSTSSLAFWVHYPRRYALSIISPLPNISRTYYMPGTNHIWHSGYSWGQNIVNPIPWSFHLEQGFSSSALLTFGAG